MTSRHEQQKRKQKLLIAVIAIVLVVIIAGLTVVKSLSNKYMPSKEKTDYETYYGLSGEDQFFIVYDNELMEAKGVTKDGQDYLPYELVNDYINNRFFWDPTESILRYTLPEGTISVSPETNAYTFEGEAGQEENIICTVDGGQMYISLNFVQKYTNIRCEKFEAPNRLTVNSTFGEVEYKAVKKKTQIREKGGIKSPILKDAASGDLVTVLEELDNWSKVATTDGFIGYIKKDALGSSKTETYEATYIEPEHPHYTMGSKVNLAWHQVTNEAANGYIADVLATTKGVNVISPTWFYLTDESGSIASIASADYVNYCHSQGVQVWGLVSNVEKPDVSSTAVLNTTSSRDNLVNLIVNAALNCGMDGINVDFEMLEGEAGDGYIQFIRELSVKCKKNNLVLSVDNYVPSSYTQHYHRDEQAVFADYVILMAYDEHFRGSEEAGSVASLGFVTKGVEDTLLEVPAEQLILGIPFYTREWVTTADGAMDSNVFTMQETEDTIASTGATMEWLDDMGQYYIEYDRDGQHCKVWMEEATSIEKKLEVMKTNGLAGAAFWKLSYEKPEIWDLIVSYMQ